MLGKEARRRHYRKADEEFILASDYGSDVEMADIDSNPDDNHSDGSISIDPPIQNNQIPSNSASVDMGKVDRMGLETAYLSRTCHKVFIGSSCLTHTETEVTELPKILTLN